MPLNGEFHFTALRRHEVVELRKHNAWRSSKCRLRTDPNHLPAEGSLVRVQRVPRWIPLPAPFLDKPDGGFALEATDGRYS